MVLAIRFWLKVYNNFAITFCDDIFIEVAVSKVIGHIFVR